MTGMPLKDRHGKQGKVYGWFKQLVETGSISYIVYLKDKHGKS